MMYAFRGHAPACKLAGQLFLVAIGCGGANLGYCAEQKPTTAEAGDLLSGLAVRNLAFKNASVRITYRDRFSYSKGSPPQTRVQVIDAIFDNFGNGFLDMVETGPSGSPPVEQKRKLTMTVNENESRVLTPSTKGDILHGRISKLRAYWWAIEPTQLCFLNRWSPEVYLNKVGNVSVEGTEVIDGVETIRIAWHFESTGPEAPGSARRGRFWVQPSRGCAVVRSEEQARTYKDSAWWPFMSREWRNVRKVGDLWLPGEVAYSEKSTYDDGTTEVRHDLTAVFEGWRVNQKLDEDVFQLKFPDGTWVTDDITNRNYVKGAITDKKLRKQAETAKSIAASPEAVARPALSQSSLESQLDQEMKGEFAHSSTYSRGWWLAMGVVIATVLGAAIFVTITLRKGAR